MYKKDVGYILYLLKMCDDIELYKEESTGLSEFLAKRSGLNAALMNLTQIGEFAGKLSVEFKNEFSQIEWRRITGLRNIIVHNYFGVDVDSIQVILEENIPELIERIIDILKTLYIKKSVNTQLIESAQKDLFIIDLSPILTENLQ